MGRYRKKPVEVDATQITLEMCLNNEGMSTPKGNSRWIDWKKNSAIICTLEGFMKAEIGDWIVTGIKGEVYPVKPDIFEQTYEPIPESAS